jgi:hypothetical protein
MNNERNMGMGTDYSRTRHGLVRKDEKTLCWFIRSYI